MSYSNPNGVRMAVADAAGLDTEQIHLRPNYDGTFELDVAPGVDWADYEPQPDREVPQFDEEGNPLPPLLVPQDDLRVQRPAWEWYRQQYPSVAAEPPDPAAVAAWLPPPPPPPEEPAPVTDVEKIFLTVSDRLNSDEAKRTGKSVDPKGAVPLSRAMAATSMLYGRWNYPTEADLSTGNNPAILAAIYADPTTKTTTESSVEQKCKVLQFTLVMLAGQQFGLDYQAELGAYERTASGAFLSRLADDQRDWLKLPCPKMHKDWPEFESVAEMFQAVMK